MPANYTEIHNGFVQSSSAPSSVINLYKSWVCADLHGNAAWEGRYL